MVQFINYLRVIATILITNSHYANVWPISQMAAGGLLGNVIFFAASGFCLYKVKENFGKWYLKRILKIYPVMLIFSLIMGLVGLYPLNSGADAISLFLFPTRYVFIVWLMISYAVYYFIAYFQNRFPEKKITEIALAIVLIAFVAVYLLFVDKSVYGIDNVENPFILFLYFTSMLMGGLFKKYADKYTKLKWYNVVLAVVFLGVYFVSKLAFSKYASIVSLQIFNQFAILLALYFTFATFMGLEEKLSKLNVKWNKAIKFIAGLTLYIYIVQFVIIAWLENLVFPLNLFAVSALILIGAIALYFAETYARKGIALLISKIKNKKANSIVSDDASTSGCEDKTKKEEQVKAVEGGQDADA